ncbi:unnamed protein product [Prorocentrum cordatum]|uniref:Solute carrier family 40 protein n=1 Tax=Prorocentrum cordatum TaxID=2364126 RepID=A0ABN9UT40_9DINO|nr:unnamed protein product [Polarella glacialis]
MPTTAEMAAVCVGGHVAAQPPLLRLRRGLRSPSGGSICPPKAAEAADAEDGTAARADAAAAVAAYEPEDNEDEDESRESIQLLTIAPPSPAARPSPPAAALSAWPGGGGAAPAGVAAGLGAAAAAGLLWTHGRAQADVLRGSAVAGPPHRPDLADDGTVHAAVASAVVVTVALASSVVVRRCVGAPPGEPAPLSPGALAAAAGARAAGDRAGATLVPDGSPSKGERRCAAGWWCVRDGLGASTELKVYMVLWAVAAETLSHCWLSAAGVWAAHFDICHGRLPGLSDGDLYSRNPDDLAGAYSVIFCNLLGTFVMGSATVCAQEWAAAQSGAALAAHQASLALRLGFCPCITTFPGAVQVSVSLVEHKARLFAVLSLFGGPILFGVGAKVARRVLETSEVQLSASFANGSVKTMLVAFIVASAVVEYGRAPLALCCGWVMSAAACLAADAVTSLAPADSMWGVRWATVIANLCALSLMACHQTVSSSLKLLQFSSSDASVIIPGGQIPDDLL